MLSSIHLTTALCLPRLDLESLTQGRMVVAMSSSFIRGTRRFALCPVQSTDSPESLRSRYRADWLTSVGLARPRSAPPSSTVTAWARLESCKFYTQPDDLETLSQLTIWNNDWLQHYLQEQRKIFLAYLRVYHLATPIEVAADIGPSRSGKFIRLPTPIHDATECPVLDDVIFAKRRNQLVSLAPPDHVLLEQLHHQLLHQRHPDLDQTRSLGHDVAVFLGWRSPQLTTSLDSDLAWIQQISTVGHSSDGHAFEKLVRRSLIKLGFSNSSQNPKTSLDPEATGGAGGIDAYCDAPYAVVVECKASGCDKVPHDVTGQLHRICLNHLGRERYANAIRLIFATGHLTSSTNNSAIEDRMNIIRPETLQRLTTLKAKYPGVVDLLQLKECLETGAFGIEADQKVNQWIDNLIDRLKLRAQVAAHVKKYQVNSNLPDSDANNLYVTFSFDNPNSISREQFDMILAELASPLVGCLGRRCSEKGWESDRFYHLRDLVVDM